MKTLNTPVPTCSAEDHGKASARRNAAPDRGACERAAAIFRALGEPARMQILALLATREMCVSEIAAELDDSLPATSQRLKLLRSERIVQQRRAGKHIFYALADGHIRKLVTNGLAHAGERTAAN